MKSTIFNLIILDESGSMGCMKAQTISGCNETLNTIRNSAEKHADTVRNLVSIYAFQSGGPTPSRYLVKNADPKDVKDITTNDYEPCGCTPLLDAVGSTLTELKTVAATHEDATAIVTIMTDGYENSSRRYTWQHVAQLISQLRELGWTINLIGANVDVEQMASELNINKSNSMAYTQSEEGTREMWNSFHHAVGRHIDASVSCCDDLPFEERVARRKVMAECFFKNPDEEEQEATDDDQPLSRK